MTTLRVVREEYHHDVPFDVDGRVLGILHSNPQRRLVTLLVEGENGGRELPVDSQATCAGKDGECSRSVDQPGDRCWQHQNEDE